MSSISQISFIRPFIKQFIETFTFSRQTLTFLAIYRIYDHLAYEPHFAGNLHYLSNLRPFSLTHPLLTANLAYL